MFIQLMSSDLSSLPSTGVEPGQSGRSIAPNSAQVPRLWPPHRATAAWLSGKRLGPAKEAEAYQRNQLAGIYRGNQGYGRIPPKCTLTKFDMGNGAKGIPPQPRSLPIPACSFVQAYRRSGDLEDRSLPLLESARRHRIERDDCNQHGSCHLLKVHTTAG